MANARRLSPAILVAGAITAALFATADCVNRPSRFPGQPVQQPPQLEGGVPLHYAPSVGGGYRVTATPSPTPPPASRDEILPATPTPAG